MVLSRMYALSVSWLQRRRHSPSLIQLSSHKRTANRRFSVPITDTLDRSTVIDVMPPKNLQGNDLRSPSACIPTGLFRSSSAGTRPITTCLHTTLSDAWTVLFPPLDPLTILLQGSRIHRDVVVQAVGTQTGMALRNSTPQSVHFLLLG
jgi:hypothetical protein